MLMMEMCIEANNDIYLALLEIRSTPVGMELPSPVTLLFNRAINVIMVRLKGMSINCDCDKDNHNTLK